MNTFNFYIDRKSTVWFRENYEIDANTKEEAILIFKNKFNNSSIDEYFINQEMLDDTITDTNIFEILDENFNKI